MKAFVIAALSIYLGLEAIFVFRLYNTAKQEPYRKSLWKKYAVKRALSSIFGMLFIITCIIAYTASVKIPRYITEHVSGTELVFVLDVSNSMLITDSHSETRLDLAKAFIKKIRLSMNDAVAALIIFKGMATTLCPATRDVEPFVQALDWANPLALTAKGSNLSAAIDESNRVSVPNGKARVIIVLTDGNTTDATSKASVLHALNTGAEFIFVGLGDDKPQPVVNSEGKKILDKNGNPIYSALKESSMREWADIARGTFVKLNDKTSFSKVFATCSALNTLTGHTRVRRVDVDASSWLAVLALLFFGAAYGLSSYPKQSIKALSIAFVTIVMTSCVDYKSFFMHEANILFKKAKYTEAAALYLKAGAGLDLAASYNLANVFLAQNEEAAALDMYKVVIESEEDFPEAKAFAWYNKGLSLYLNGKYEDAQSSFKEALLAYVDVKNNKSDSQRQKMSMALELSKKAITRQNISMRERGSYQADKFDGVKNSFITNSLYDKALFTQGTASYDAVDDH